MKKRDSFVRICALLLAVCVGITSITAAQKLKVYAQESLDILDGEGESYVDDDSWLESEEVKALQEQSQDVPVTEPQSDPFDYNLVCYTPSISFGQINKGEVVNARQFTIVNVGSTQFPITWEEVDPNTAFSCGQITPDEYLDPGESAGFSVVPEDGLEAGVYTARYTFFSANDYRRHHTAVVDVSVTVKDATPYVTSVVVTPGAVTIPMGKSYRFDSSVDGGNGYDASVIWSLSGNQSQSTTVDGAGFVTVGSNETATSFAVIATSLQDPSKVGRGIITVSSVDYVVSVRSDPAEGGAVAGGSAVRSGGSCTVSASANNNYVFRGWYEGGSLVSESGQMRLDNVTRDYDLVAKFERRTCYVRTNVNNGDGGSVSGGGSVNYGGSFTITANPKNGYYFAGFVENGQTISNASSIQINNITSDRNITAVFERSTCRVNVSVNPSDTGKFEGAGTYNKGSRVELKASAYDGFEFVGWSINGQVVSRDNRYVINEISGDVNLVANFMKKNATTYKIVSGIATAGGSITPSGEYVIAEGGSVTYNIMPAADYKITAVMVDGKNIGAVSSYTFNNVRGGHSITASFEKKPEPIVPKSDTSTAKTTSGQTKKASSTQKETTVTPKNTDYNEDTAAKGAVPEQNVVEQNIPEEVDSLEGEEYEEDVYTEYEEAQIPEETPIVSVMSKHNMDETTLRILIDDDAVLPMLREAYEDGTLQITVNNGYAEDKQETAVELYYKQPTLLNFEDVIAETLTKEEKYNVLTGTPVSFNIDITENTATIDEGTKQLMQKKIGYKPVSYFDFLILKTSGGITSVINNTTTDLEVVLPIPEQYRKEGRKFYVLRNHNGVVDVLDDIGNDPASITFKTDRFSEYAIAYEAININRLILRVVLVAVVSLILAIICFANLLRYKRMARK